MQRNIMPTLRVSTALIGLAVPISTALDNVLLALVVLSLLFNAPTLWKITTGNPVARAGCALFAMLLLAITYGSTPFTEALGILGKYMDLAFIPLFILMFTQPNTRLWAERAFMLAMGVTLLISYALNVNIIGIQSWMNMFATAENPAVFHSHITQNNMMAYAIFLALLKIRDTPNIKLRLAWGAYTLLGIVNVLFMVQGRTGYMILLMLLCWFAWSSLSRHFIRQGKIWGWKQTSSVLLATVVLTFTAYSTSSRLHERVSLVGQEFHAWHPNYGNESSSTGQRLDFYYNTAQIIGRNWLIGVGTGGFPDAFTQQVQGTDAMRTHNPHNEYLMITVQTGVLGLLLLLYLFYTEWRVAPLLETAYAQDAARGLVLAYIVNCLFNSALHDHADGLFFAFMSALWFSTLRVSKP